MNQSLQRLNDWIVEVPLIIQHQSEIELTKRPLPHKWSKKEILGHLCDSALTNLQRFVRVQYEPQPYTILKYTQDDWVRLMGYQSLPVDHILNLWLTVNKQIYAVATKIPEEKWLYRCDVGEDETVTVQWLLIDYIQHLEHHMKQIAHNNIQ